MAENLMKLKRKAVSLGMDAKHARTASRADLEAFVSEHTETRVVKKRKKVAAPAPVAKKAKKPAPAKRRGRPPKQQVEAPAPKKRGRPAKNTNHKVTDETGRAAISKLDYNIDHDGWNPRKGSPVERIWKSLKKNRDNVDKVFDELLPHVKEIVGAKKRTGEKRTKTELEATLRYRINRTRFEFAVRTEQHESATNRVVYGTGKYAAKKSTKKRTPAKKR